MRITKTIKNLFYNTLQQFIAIIVNFILPPIIITTFGSTINGLVAMIKQTMSYLQLTGAGIGSAATYAFYGPFAKKDEKEISKVFNASKDMFNKAGHIFTVIVIITAIIYPFFVKENINNLLIFCLIIVMSVAGLTEFYIIGKYQSLLNADQKNYIVAFAQIVGNIINVIVVIILIKLNQNILTVQIGGNIIFIMRVIIIISYVKKNYNYLDKNIKFQKNTIAQRNDAVIHELTALVVNNSSTILIPLFLGLSKGSVYSVYLLVFSGLNTICSVFSNSVYASFGEIIANGERKILKQTFSTYEWLYTQIVTIIYVSTFLLIIPFLQIYTANMLDEVYVILSIGILFSIVGYLNNLKIPARTLVIAAGKFKATKKYSIIEMLINLTLQIILIPFLGLKGALIGGLVSNIYRTIQFVTYSNKNVIIQSNRESVKRFIISLMTSTVVIIFINHFIIINNSSYLNWSISAALVVTIISFALFLVNLIFEKNEMIHTWMILKKLLSFKKTYKQ